MIKTDERKHRHSECDQQALADLTAAEREIVQRIDKGRARRGAKTVRFIRSLQSRPFWWFLGW